LFENAALGLCLEGHFLNKKNNKNDVTFPVITRLSHRKQLNLTMADPKQQAFLQAYQACHAPFVRYCSALAYGKMDAEDLVQDVLLSAYKHFEKIEKKDQLLHYLIRSARNRSISNWRKQKYKAELLEQHTERLMAQDLSADALLDIQLLYRTLDKLPEKQRDAVILFEISGFSMKEIAVIQDSNEGAVRTMVSRGRRRLKELLENNSDSVKNILGVQM